MTHRERNQWRTVVTSLGHGFYLLAGAWLCGRMGGEVGPRIYEWLSLGIAALGVGQAGKSAWQAHSEARAAAKAVVAPTVVPTP